MRHALYGSLDELLSPEALGGLEGRRLMSVCTRPWTPTGGSFSGSPFLRVETAAAGGERRRYVVKRTAPAWDIIMRITADRACRELLVWQHGLLDQLPPEVGHAILAGAIDGEGWALLMRDVGDTLLPAARWPAPDWEPLGVADTACLLDALAALHARYWEDPTLRDPSHGLCDSWWLYSSLSPASAQREIDSPHPFARNILAGWQQLETLVAPDVADLVRRLLHDPRPLCAALDRYPRTLVHGDPKLANVGIERGAAPRVVLLDWQFVTPAPPAVDLAWLLWMGSASLPIPLDEAIEQYRDCLARRLGRRFDERWWRPQLELALLGGFLRRAQSSMRQIVQHESAAIREHHRALLAWWTPWARAGARWL